MTTPLRLITAINGVPIDEVDPETIRFNAGDRIAVEVTATPLFTILMCRCGFHFNESNVDVMDDPPVNGFVRCIARCPLCGWSHDYMFRPGLK